MRIKRASKDFTSSNLPSNRKEVFFDCIKINYLVILKSGLMLLLFSLPFFFIILLKKLSIYGLASEELTEEELLASVTSITIVYNLLLIPASFILSLGVSGLTRVIRQLGWEEPPFFSTDFFDGIKMNYKQICVHVLFLTLIYAIADTAKYIPMNSKLFIYLPMIIFVVAAIPIGLYSIAQTNVYNLTIGQSIKNSLLYFIKSIPVCLIFSAILFGVSFIRMIPNIAISSCIYIILILLGIPLYYLAFSLCTNRLFDKCLNVNYYPELVDKGLVRKEGYEPLKPTIELVKEEPVNKDSNE